MEYFKIDPHTVRDTISEALRYGGDYADIYCQHIYSSTISMQNEKVNRANSNISYGAGIRVIHNEHIGYAYVEDINREQLLKAARTAAGIANERCKTTMPANLTQLVPEHNYYSTEQKWENCEVSYIVDYLKEIDQRLRQRDPRIITTNALIAYKSSVVAFCNSLGECYHDVQPLASLSIMCVAKDGDKTESANASRSFRMGAEMLDENLKATLVDECIDKIQFALKAIQPQGGTMPVVMGAGASGILLHEAIGHAFEADHIRKDQSIFTNSLGKKICLSSINIVDDGTLQNNRGAINFDDEGVPGQKTYIVRKGVLTNFLHDRISAKFFGVKPTGNGRRTSFRYFPIPRMRATYMEGGEATENDLIKDVKKGIFVNNFTNGQVQIGVGDFSFYVKSGYLIENGKLTEPIKDVNIMGNGPQTLADIQAVANNPKIDNGTWMCGKDGQSCPVSCGMPSVLISKMTVGGR